MCPWFRGRWSAPNVVRVPPASCVKPGLPVRVRLIALRRVRAGVDHSPKNHSDLVDMGMAPLAPLHLDGL